MKTAAVLIACAGLGASFSSEASAGEVKLLVQQVSPNVEGRTLDAAEVDWAPATKSTPALSAPPAPAATGQPAPQQMVDAMYAAFGDHHVRAVHAKGVMADGVFEPSAEALSLTPVVLFRRGPLPVRVRFSNFTGIPDIPDPIGEANPRGFALKFSLPDGSTADVVTHSFNGFPTATAEEFRQFLLAIGASGPDAAHPTALEAFLASHPVAKTFVTTQKPAPASYATLTYFGVNAFAFVGPGGRKIFVRYRFVPRGGEAFVPAAEVQAKGRDYLRDELPKRLAQGPVVFDWYAQVAGPGDVIGDPSVAWPQSRRLVRLGTVRLDRMTPDGAEADRSALFLPLNVPRGIEPADAMLGLRQAAYPLSFRHRQ